MMFPETTSQLVGRERELEALCGYLVGEGARLVTLTGPGGIGKTRLALAAVSNVQSNFADGAAFVDLSPLSVADHVPTAIAGALGVADTGTRSVLESLVAALRDRRQVLILDNFERVLAAAGAVDALTQACAGVVVVVTSRAPLHLAAERELAVGGLGREASAALFVERARTARAGFVTNDAAGIDRICERLDGIPLAIELAAARIKVLSPSQIADRLHDRFSLLTAGNVDAPSRHRTLRAALDWSFELLPEPERALLRRMGVFAGSASIEALEQVCPGGALESANVLDCLSELVDQSLVSVTDRGSVARYQLLDTVRQYALERLGEAKEDATTRAAHADWCATYVESVEPNVRGADQLFALEQLERDHDNFRAALTWSLETASASASASTSTATSTALRLGGGLWKFWEVRGHAGEGERWLEAVLALHAPDGPARSKALHGAANLAFVRGDYERASMLHSSNLQACAMHGDQLGRGIALFHLASVYRCRGELDAAIAACDESLAIFRGLDDRQWCANALNSLGFMLRDRGSFARGRVALEEALSLYRALGGTRRIAIALLNLGDLARGENDLARAEKHLCQSLGLFVELRDAWCSSVALENLAQVCVARDQMERACVLFGAAEAQRDEAGAALPPVDQPEHDAGLARIAPRLGRKRLAEAFERGRGLSREDAMDCFRGADVNASVAAVPAWSPLTEREREVAARVAGGLTNKQIADDLTISKQTADKHVANILSKLGVATRSQVAVWWVQQAPAAAAAAAA